MEFDIGNLIYILFVLVLFIVNLFTKAKKKQQQQGGSPDNDPSTLGPPPSKGKSFEELLAEFTSGQSEPTPEPAPAPRPVAQPKPAPVPTYQAPKPKPAIPKKEHSIMTTSFGRFDEFEDDNASASEYIEELSEQDGARKAFIYSEIFKRKF